MRKFLAFLSREIKEIIPPTIYFMLVFHLLAFTKTVIMTADHFTFTRSAIATAGALTVAKAILIADKRRFANLFSKGPLFYDVAWKAAVFSVFTVLFRILEELIPLIGKEKSLGNATAHLLSDTRWLFFWVMQLWLYGSLLLYCLITELGKRVGAKDLQEVLFAPRSATARAGPMA